MHNHYNGLKTAALFGGMWALLLAIGWMVATWLGSSVFLLVFALIGVATTVYGYWNSDKLAIKAMHAYPVSEAEAPAMYRIVRELSTAAGKPMPRLYISPTQAPNAFATGRNPENAAVCCTEGILGLLDERELRGVLGHELMHVYNRDILTSSVAAAIAGVISTIGQFLSFGMMFGGGGSSDENRNPIAGLALAHPRPVRGDGGAARDLAAPVSTTPTRTALGSPATRWPWPRRCASSSSASPGRRSPRPSRSSTRAT